MTTINLSKTRLLILMIFICLVGVKQVFAQSASPSASLDLGQKFGLAYPIVELGGCKDFASCRNFCGDPVHKDACIAFAKTKGFYKEDATTVKAKTILDAAKVELGCNSFDSCQSFCETNRDKCDSFAKSHQLVGGRVDDPVKNTIIQRAKEVLGCNSEDSCKTLCSQAANQQKCSDFAKSVGLIGGEVRQGPGGCSSEQTCRAFCSDPKNFDQCAKFAGGPDGPNGQFKGPGGCTDRTSCEIYCQSHQTECSHINDNQTAPINTKEFVDFCKTSPDKCQFDRYCHDNPAKCQKDFVQQGVGEARLDMGGCKTPGECYDWCKSNVSKCPGFNPTAPRPDDSQYTQYTQTNYDPQAACKKGGCTWGANFCQCPSSGYNYQQAYPAGFTPVVPNASNRDIQESNCKSMGGTCTSWPNDVCNCSGMHSPSGFPGPGSAGGYSGTMMIRDQQEAGCKSGGGTCNWNGDSCNCQGYKAPTSGYSGSGYGVPPGAPRDQQESSCRSCGGTCNWSGDSCNCHCAGMGITPPPPPPNPPPPPAPPAPPPPAQPPASPTVKGINTQKGLIEIIWDLLNSH